MKGMGTLHENPTDFKGTHKWWRLQGSIALRVPAPVLCCGKKGMGTLHEDSHLFVQVARTNYYLRAVTLSSVLCMHEQLHEHLHELDRRHAIFVQIFMQGCSCTHSVGNFVVRRGRAQRTPSPQQSLHLQPQAE